MVWASHCRMSPGLSCGRVQGTYQGIEALNEHYNSCSKNRDTSQDTRSLGAGQLFGYRIAPHLQKREGSFLQKSFTPSFSENFLRTCRRNPSTFQKTFPLSRRFLRFSGNRSTFQKTFPISRRFLHFSGNTSTLFIERSVALTGHRIHQLI